MKKIVYLLLVLFVMAIAACDKKTDEVTPTDPVTEQETETENEVTKPTEDKVTEDATTEDVVTKDEVTEDKTTEDVVTEDGPTEDEPTEDKVTEDPKTEDKVTEDPETEDKVTEDPETEDKVTEDPETEDPVPSDVVEVLKDSDSFELELEASQVINLKEYFKYEGSKYTYEVTTEEAGVVETELLNDTLTVYIVKSGVEKVTVTLNNKKVEFTFTISGVELVPEFDTLNVSYDLSKKQSVEVTLAPSNANGFTEFSYSIKEETTGVSIENNVLTVSITELCEKTVVLVCTYGEDLTVEFTLNISVIDSSLNVINGSFDNGLEGWTLVGEIGAITENSVFWNQEFPMNNVGKYFDGHAGVEANHGTLTSSLFKLDGNGYITFMLGGAANPECLVKVINEEGNILAIYRNTEFRDLKPEHNELTYEEQRELIGTEVNVCNLVKYKADLSDYIGEVLQVVVVDNAESNFGLVFFDELNCYHTEELGDDYVLATDQLADVTELNELIENKVDAQGDYTVDSYNLYALKVTEALAALNNPHVTQAKVDELVSALTEAQSGLTLREITLKEAETSEVVIVGNSVTFDYQDYFDTAELSSVTFDYSTSLELSLIEGVLTLDTTGLELGKYDVVLKALYKEEVKKEVTVCVEVVAEPTVTVKEEVLTYEFDIYSDGNEFSLDLSTNIIVVGGLEVTYVVDGEEIESTLNVSLTEGTQEYDVVVKYTYETEKEVSYKVVLSVSDTTKYHVVNGSFNNDLEGWTLEGEEFAAVSENRTFWGEEYPMYNEGKYFDAYGKNDLEPNKGTLTSSLFTLGGNGYITFMFGGAGNPNCFVKVVDKDGNILAIYRNTEFKDFSEEQKELPLEEKRALIGNGVNLANLIKFKADLSKHIGKEIQVVVVDNASSGWGVIYFDELNTYYTVEVGEVYIEAVNQLADLTIINELIENKVDAQGDYTVDSYNKYLKAVVEAEKAITDPYITPSRVDELVNAINTAKDALALREITLKDVNTNLKVTVDKSLEILYADYFDTNSLSSITYEVESELVLSISEDGLLFVATDVEVKTYEVVLKVLYKEEVKQTVTLTVEVTEDKTPLLVKDAVAFNEDKYNYDKEVFECDLASNVINAANLELTYVVNDVELEGSVYTHEFDGLTHSYEVLVYYNIDDEEGCLEFTISLMLFDTTPNRLVNGGFEYGLEGWTLVGNIGNVTENSHYWLNDPESAEGFAYGKDGDKLFDAYAEGSQEAAVGTLTSSNFTVGGSGFVTFKLGAMRDGNYVYMDVVDANTKEILARYYNGLWSERTDDIKSGCTLVAYKANLSAFAGREVFFRISDNADSGYGLFFVDSFVTYYESEPEGFNAATPVNYEISGSIYNVFNGGFEYGDCRGWWNNGEPGAVTNANAFFSGVEYGKEGNFLYSGVEDHLAGNGREGNRGSLTSSVFEISGSGYITFMLGGGANELCYVQVIDAVTNEVLARYHQQAMEDAVLKTYVANLSEFIGRTARIQVVDYAFNNWGCVSFDNVVTYYASTETLPEGIEANNIFGSVYDVRNGSFENGLDGWNMDIYEAGAHNTLGWVESSEHDAGWYTKNDGRKDGNNLFTFARPDGTNCENTKGALNSSLFTLKKDSYVSFRFGGAGSRDVHVQLVRVDGTVIATFYNEAPGKINTEMHAYYYQYTGETADCYFRVVDNSTSNYGCFVVDDFRANLTTAPEGFIPAIQ